MKKILLCLLMVFTPAALAWDHVGHKLIGHIAYHHLNPKAKLMVDRLTMEPNHDYQPEARFLYISNWADWERAKGNNQFNTWHYIDFPYADVGFLAKPPETQNVVYGINHCVGILKQPARSSTEQQTALKMLVHLVGDIHQPFHNFSRYNFKHPGGDHGGNSYQIRSKTASTLHA
nr:S1/P1 nuclease [Pseudomonadota bacterium]